MKSYLAVANSQEHYLDICFLSSKWDNQPLLSLRNTAFSQSRPAGVFVLFFNQDTGVHSEWIKRKKPPTFKRDCIYKKPVCIHIPSGYVSFAENWTFKSVQRRVDALKQQVHWVSKGKKTQNTDVEAFFPHPPSKSESEFCATSLSFSFMQARTVQKVLFVLSSVVDRYFVLFMYR